MLGYIIVLFKRLILKEDNSIETYTFLHEFHELREKGEGKIDLKESEASLYGYFVDAKG